VRVLVGTTLAAYVMDNEFTWSSWLRRAEKMRESWPDGVDFFAAIEVDARGLEPFAPLLERLREVNGSWWTFSLDDGRTEVTTANRLRHITMGQNLVTDRACEGDYSHLLFLAADLLPQEDTIPKLVEMDHPIVGGECSTYCLTGPWQRERYPNYPVEEHMATAAYVMLRRDLFRFIRWRWDRDAGMSDDPCLYYDAQRYHGLLTYVRKDVVGRHFPEAIPAIELRGHDRSVVRR
jgi:hypothetical protein